MPSGDNRMGPALTSGERWQVAKVSQQTGQGKTTALFPQSRSFLRLVGLIFTHISLEKTKKHSFFWFFACLIVSLRRKMGTMVSQQIRNVKYGVKRFDSGMYRIRLYSKWRWKN